MSGSPEYSVERDGTTIQIEFQSHEFYTVAHFDPNEARRFAREVLALVDEIFTGLAKLTDEQREEVARLNGGEIPTDDEAPTSQEESA